MPDVWTLDRVLARGVGNGAHLVGEGDTRDKEGGDGSCVMVAKSVPFLGQRIRTMFTAGSGGVVHLVRGRPRQTSGTRS